MRRPAPWYGLQHVRLLKAIVGGEDEVIACFRAWNAEVDWDGEFDAHTYSVLPVVFKSLERFAFDGSDLGRLRGLYRRAWYEAQQRRVVHDELVGGLQESGVPLMLLGDGAVALTCPAAAGAQSLRDLELMVPSEHRERSTAVLQGLGFRLVGRDPCGDEFERILPGGPPATTCTVRWRSRRPVPSGAHEIWSRAGVAELSGREITVPAPTDLLLELMAGSWAATSSPPLLRLAWIGTVAADSAIDWSAIVDRSRRSFSALRVFHCLSYLRETVALGVPPSALERLGRLRISFPERVDALRASRAPDAPDPFWGPMERLWTGFLRHAGPVSPRSLVLQFPGFVRSYYSEDSYLRIIKRIGLNGVRRTHRLIRRTLMDSANAAH